MMKIDPISSGDFRLKLRSALLLKCPIVIKAFFWEIFYFYLFLLHVYVNLITFMNTKFNFKNVYNTSKIEKYISAIYLIYRNALDFNTHYAALDVSNYS